MKDYSQQTEHGNTADIRLTPHFTLSEMTASGTAIKQKIDNQPSEQQIVNLQALCENILEPVRRRFGRTLISSGYRSEALNKAVGGVGNSQHLLGEAADIHCSSVVEARRRYDFIRQNLDYDQLLLEHVHNIGTCWLHVSYVRQPGRRKNRHDARVFTARG